MKKKVQKKVPAKKCAKKAVKPAAAMKALKKLLTARRKEYRGFDKILAKHDASVKATQAEIKEIRKGVKILADEKLTRAYEKSDAALKVQVKSGRGLKKQLALTDAAFEKTAAAIDKYIDRPLDALEDKICALTMKFLEGVDVLTDRIRDYAAAVGASDAAVTTLGKLVTAKASSRKRGKAS